MRILLALLLLAAFATLAFTPHAPAVVIPANLTPTPEPTPVWDQSVLNVTAFCNKGVPTFTISNSGAAMTGPTDYLFTNSTLTGTNCDALGTEDGSGSVQLGAGGTLTLIWPDQVAEPPYSLCVQQRPGYPGPAWTAATVSPGPECATGIDITGPPTGPRWLYLPALRNQ